MWYFTWVLGIGFAVLLAILNAIWLEHSEDRQQQFDNEKLPQPGPNSTTRLD